MTAPSSFPMHWQTARFTLTLDRPLVMGIVNTTPDSFSDGGRFARVADACAHCDRLLEQGADILDIGGESTRPGAPRPDAEEELSRVLPVLRHAVTLGCPVSVDTSQPEVMHAAVDTGVDIINDVRSLARPGALDAAAHSRVGVCLMHMRGEPETMQAQAQYADVVQEVHDFLAQRLRDVSAAGVSLDRIVLDPGIGFAKSAEHNWRLLRYQRQLLDLGRPLLVGWSRKSSLGGLTGRPADQRVAASVAAALASVQRGAMIVRVHDVAETVDALKVWHAAGLPDNEV
ncbi:MAG TPA: dihydropteroate synthase [Aquabacterium sp.]|nr:dihydropteroate synthase [Aquabacterium sp.]